MFFSHEAALYRLVSWRALVIRGSVNISLIISEKIDIFFLMTFFKLGLQLIEVSITEGAMLDT